MKIYLSKISDTIGEFGEKQLYDSIPEFRKKAADSCKNETDYKRSLVASYLLGICLKEQEIVSEDNVDTQHLVPQYTSSGKMYFPELDRFYVNLSHSGDYAVCAYDANEIGVDVESVRAYREKVVNKICSEEEIAWLNSAQDDDEKNHFFTKLWTVKESQVKLTGKGIAGLLEEIQEEKPKINQNEDQDYRRKIFVKTFHPYEDCYVSVASFDNMFCDEIVII